MGRRKIEIKKLEEKSNRDVTFSKRRVGLFKKAYELSVMCGAKVSIVVFSPGNKAYSCGYPNVEIVTDRFLSENHVSDDDEDDVSGISSASSSSSVDIAELNREYTETVKQLEAEKRKGEKLQKEGYAPWNKLTADLSLDELEQLQASMEELKKNVEKQRDLLYVKNSSWLSL